MDANQQIPAATPVEYTLSCILRVQVDHKGTNVEYEPFDFCVVSTVPPPVDGALYIGLYRYLIESVAMGVKPEVVVSLEDLEQEHRLGPDGVADLVETVIGRRLRYSSTQPGII